MLQEVYNIIKKGQGKDFEMLIGSFFFLAFLIFIAFMAFKAKENFGSWDPDFKCKLTDLDDFASKTPDGEDIKTSYGEGPIGDFYVDAPFAATGYTQNVV